MYQLDYGVPQDKAGLQLRLGIEKGFFRDEGIDLNVRVIFGGPEIAAAYDTGELMFGEFGTPPATTALSKGARFRIIGSGARRRALQSLVARPEIREWSDLRGTRAATLSTGSCSHWFMRLVLSDHGIDPDRDLTMVGLGTRYPQVLELFERNEIQAAVISEPSIAIGESRGLLHVMETLTDQKYCPGMQWSVVVANTRAIETEPELLRAGLRASRRSYHYCARHPEEWTDYAASYCGTDRATMARALAADAQGLELDCTPDIEGLQQAIDLQRRLGAIKESMRALDIVDLRFLPEVDATA